MTSASPSPKSPEVSEKSKKYDRQLRLWGDHGQNSLEKSRICLINATATGTEILKSLILPGCGSFVIVDGHRVTQEDLGTNFFLDVTCLNQSRAECTRRLLSELNPEVNGEFVPEHADALLKVEPRFFDTFSIVIGCQLSESVLDIMSRLLWENGVPFLNVETTGFLGWIRIQLNEHTIIESHPDHPKVDLRLDTPFPELIAHMDSIQIKGREESGKTPWLTLMYKALQSYLQKDSQDGNANESSSDRYPKTIAQKREFREFIKNYMRNVELKDDDDAFEEAVKALNTALAKTEIPSEINSILEDPKISKPENKFWVLCAALKQFLADRNGQLPVRGVLPDMTADSEKYISLQNVYREKASKDSNEIFDKACQIIKQSGLQSLNLTLEDVRLFCKESFNLRVIRGYPIFEELSSTPQAVLQGLENMEEYDMELVFYIMMRAYLRYFKEYNKYPGADGTEADTSTFKTTVTKLLNEWKSSIEIRDDFIHEMCRYGGAELPSIAAFLGGCAAQEAIKIVTSQYVPLDNTFIYNAITSTSRSFKLQASV